MKELAAVFLVLAALQFVGCGRRSTEPSDALAVPPPTMASMEQVLLSFEATPRSIQAGASALLSWSTSAKCTKVEITNLGEQPTTGSVKVAPSQTSEYCITASGPVRLPNRSCITITVGG